MTSTGFDPQQCGDRLLAVVENTTVLTIVAPFITITGIQPILDALPPAAELEIITRWRPDEVAAGVSDPGVLDLVSERGGTLALHPTVHAKVYLAPHRALVGSANVTQNGLGWHRPGALEILVEVPSDEPAVAELVRLARMTSVQATDADRDAVLAAASILPKLPLKARTTDDRCDWLPTYRPPDVLWRVYTGQREESVAEIVRPEIAALGIPEGLTSEPAFNAYIAAILRQGFTGRVARECSNLTTVKAVQKLAQLCAQTGRELQDPVDEWETLAAWISHFMPGYQRVPGGTRLIG